MLDYEQLLSCLRDIINLDQNSLEVIRRDLVHAWRKTRPEVAADLSSVIFSKDNAPAHTEQSTMLKIDLLDLRHPQCSPDLALMDFALFQYLKSKLHWQRFSDLNDLRNATKDIVQKFDKSWYVDMKSVLN